MPIKSFNWIDYTVIAVIALSVLVSFARGFVREAISLVVWVSAFIVSFTLSPTLALFFNFIKTPSLRLLCAFVVLFVAVLITGAIITFLLRTFIDQIGLSEVDRFLGGLFGMVRGVLLISVVVLLSTFTIVTQDAWWTQSQLLPYFYGSANWLRNFLPDQAKHLSTAVLKTACSTYHIA